MYFKKAQHAKYPKGFFLSDNRLFALGVVGEEETAVLQRVRDWEIIKVLKLPVKKLQERLEVISATDPNVLMASLGSFEHRADITKNPDEKKKDKKEQGQASKEAKEETEEGSSKSGF